MKICIIGGTGRMGQFFNSEFISEGFKTELVGRANYKKLPVYLKKSDVIIISIPIHKVEKTIKDISKLVKKEQLVIDLSSVMLNESKLKDLKCGSAFIHPLFGPSIKNLGQAKFLVVPLNKNQRLNQFLKYLKSKGSLVKLTTVEKHNKLMAYIQALAHFNSIHLAKTLADSDLDADEIDSLSTTFFRLNLDAISRIFAQSPEMYANIQFNNKLFEKIIEKHEQNLRELKKIVSGKNLQAYEKIFAEISKKFEKIFSTSFKESQDIVNFLPGSKIKIGILGPAGSFTEVAANNFKKEARKLFFESATSVIEAVRDGIVDFGVVPIENSIGGSVAEVEDAIYNNSLTIQKTIVVPISHCIAAISKKTKPDILLSHPQAFLQCSKFIEQKYPNSKKINTLSTSAAFKKIATEYLTNAAAIGPKLAAEMYNLKIIAEKIENKNNNKTRFAVISKSKEIDTKAKKTSIVIYPKKDRPGLLYDLLKHFKQNKINLTKIASRPSKTKLGVYVFHIDFDGNYLDKKVQNLIKKIKNNNTKITFLGSYYEVKVK